VWSRDGKIYFVSNAHGNDNDLYWIHAPASAVIVPPTIVPSDAKLMLSVSPEAVGFAGKTVATARLTNSSGSPIKHVSVDFTSTLLNAGGVAGGLPFSGSGFGSTYTDDAGQARYSFSAILGPATTQIVASVRTSDGQTITATAPVRIGP
jgi:hypothetical protein